MELVRLLAALAPATTSGPTAGVEVRSLAYDSRRVEPGALFVAIEGYTTDGHRFVDEACERGAVAVVAQRPVGVPPGVSLAVVADTRAALSRLSAAFYGYPAEKVAAVGVTGTNGKTTTTHLIHSILDRAGRAPALLSTVEERLGSERRAARWTTPESLELQAFLAQAHRRGCRSVVMEVSSQALVDHRTDDVRFQAAVFTNLAPEHLDFHRTMAAYGEAKALLFRRLPEGAVAVLNVDDPFSGRLAEVTPARVVTYGMESPAEVRGRVLEVSPTGTRSLLELGAERVEVCTPLLGRHNVTNCLAAAAAARALGVERGAIVAGIEALESVPGRLERVEVGQPFTVLVDYAHTDHALGNVLEAVRGLCEGRVLVVFGCGGDRDRGKRPRMGAVAAARADEVWLTSDNPRSEDPQAIISEVLRGIEDRRRVHVEPDRARAIAQALAAARPGDLVLIAGKGHEAYQIVGAERRPFDDRVVAAQALRRQAALAAGEERSR